MKLVGKGLNYPFVFEIPSSAEEPVKLSKGFWEGFVGQALLEKGFPEEAIHWFTERFLSSPT